MNVKMMRRLAVLLPLLVLIVDGRRAGPGEDHHPQGVPGVRRRRRLLAGELHAAQGLLGEARPGDQPDEAGGHRQDGRGPADDHGHLHLPGEPEEPGALQGDLPEAGARRGAHRRPGPEAGGRRQGGGLDRRRAARHRVRAGAAPVPARLPDGQPDRRRDDAVPERRDPARGARPTRTAWSSCRTGTCATPTRRRARWTSRASTRSTSGHDNNRDSYTNNQPETTAISRQQFIEWNPQIMYNQHQTGPAGTVLFMAPFRDPFNYNYDPLVPQGIELVGAAMHTRFITEGQAGRGAARARRRTRPGSTAASARRRGSTTRSAC